MLTLSSLRFPTALALAAASAMTLVSPAHAAGYDTPMLYSARNMGMGGAAIGYTDDPSSIFHNPAGLAHVKGGVLMGDFSPLMGSIKGSPGTAAENAQNIKSNTTFAPFFLVGGAYRIWDKLVAGFGVYPVASAGASYDYSFQNKNYKGEVISTTKVFDFTKLAFIEFAPSLAYEILPGLRLGVAYRAALVEFSRYKMATDSQAGQADVKNPQLDMPMKGWNFEGFRVGLQYTYDRFDFGLVFRNKTRAVVEADHVIASTLLASNATYQFVLPAKFGGGLQWRATDDLRLALDVEYALNSENWSTNLAGHVDGSGDVAIANISQWQDSMTARVGGGYKIGDLEVRLGYAYDSKASNGSFPSPFGTPPGATMIFTGGLGYNLSKNLDVSLAGAYRTGSGTAVADGKGCAFCGKAGDYEINLFGAYVDVRWRFGEPTVYAPMPVVETAPAPEPAPAPAPAPAPEAAVETPKA